MADIAKGTHQFYSLSTAPSIKKSALEEHFDSCFRNDLPLSDRTTSVIIENPVRQLNNSFKIDFKECPENEEAMEFPDFIFQGEKHKNFHLQKSKVRHERSRDKNTQAQKIPPSISIRGRERERRHLQKYRYPVSSAISLSTTLPVQKSDVRARKFQHKLQGKYGDKYTGRYKQSKKVLITREKVLAGYLIERKKAKVTTIQITSPKITPEKGMNQRESIILKKRASSIQPPKPMERDDEELKCVWGKEMEIYDINDINIDINVNVNVNINVSINPYVPIKIPINKRKSHNIPRESESGYRMQEEIERSKKWDCVRAIKSNIFILSKLPKQTLPNPSGEGERDKVPLKTILLGLEDTLIVGDLEGIDRGLPLHYSQENHLPFVLRPGARDFLANLGKYCEILLYSSGAPSYIRDIMNTLHEFRANIRHVLSMRDCYRLQEGVFLKSARIVANRSIHNIIVVDAHSWLFPHDLHNIFPIPVFRLQHYHNDKELYTACEYILSIINVKDVRTIFKQKFALKEQFDNLYHNPM